MFYHNDLINSRGFNFVVSNYIDKRLIIEKYHGGFNFLDKYYQIYKQNLNKDICFIYIYIYIYCIFPLIIELEICDIHSSITQIINKFNLNIKCLLHCILL